MNYTLDDDSTLLVFSNGWGVQNSQNPYLDQYFLQTYHVAQTDGASLNLTFPGSYPYVAIYGSKGPGHADYSVQFDDTVIDLSANTEQTQFRQILFQRALPNITTDHFVRLVANFGQSESAWLDIDYVVIADGSAPTTTAAPVATLTPPYVSGYVHASILDLSRSYRLLVFPHTRPSYAARSEPYRATSACQLPAPSNTLTLDAAKHSAMDSDFAFDTSPSSPL